MCTFPLIVFASISIAAGAQTQERHFYPKTLLGSELSTQASFDSLNMRFVGSWPFGPSLAVTPDSIRSLLYLSSGGAVYVLDVSDPANPAEVSDSLTTRGRVRDLFYEPASQRLYVASGYAGLQIWDLSSPGSPTRLGVFDTGGCVCAAQVIGTYAYLGDYSGLWVIDVSDPADPQLVGVCFTCPLVIDIVVMSSYAYVVHQSHLAVIDVSTPVSPQEVGRLENLFATAICASSGYLYLARSGNLSVADVSIPTDPQIVGVCDTLGSFCWAAHVYGDYVLVTAQASSGDRFYAIDVSSPTAPEAVGSCVSPRLSLDLSSSGQHSYAVDSKGGVSVIDVGDPTDPIPIGGFDTPGWTSSVEVVPPYVYLTDEDDGIMRVIDTNDPADPRQVASCATGHAAVDIDVSGPHAYIAASASGLKVIDVSTPTSPTEVGTFDSLHSVRSVCVSGDRAYITDIWSPWSLLVLDISAPEDPMEIGHCTTHTCPRDISVEGTCVYIPENLGNDPYFEIVDVSSPTNPFVAGGCSTAGLPFAAAVSYPYAYAVSDWAGLRVIDVSDPTDPQEIGSLPSSCWWRCIYLSGDYAYIGDASWGGGGPAVRAIDIISPSTPHEVGFYTMPEGPATDIYVSGDYIYVSHGGCGLQIYENLLVGVNELVDVGSRKSGYRLWVNRPNPFRSSTLISHSLPQATEVTLAIYDITGRLVETLVNETQQPGIHQVRWNRKDNASGVYFYTLRAGEFVETRKMVVVE